MKKVRNDQMDAAVGLMTICVCLLHVEPDNAIVDILYFFMPFFFFKGGMFFHRKNDIVAAIKKSFKRLIVPFCFFALLGFLSRCIQYRNDLHLNIITTQFSSFLYEGAPWCLPTLWFITSLFFVRLIFTIVANSRLLDGLSIIALIIAIADGYDLINFINYSPFYYVCLGVFFFNLGVKNSNKEIPRTRIAWVFILFILVSFANLSIVDMRTNAVWKGDYFCYIIGSVCGCLLFCHLFNNIKEHFVLLEYIGRNSMTIYCSHMVLLILVRSFYHDEPNQMIVELFVLLLFLPIIVQIFKLKKLKWLIGE